MIISFVAQQIKRHVLQENFNSAVHIVKATVSHQLNCHTNNRIRDHLIITMWLDPVLSCLCYSICINMVVVILQPCEAPVCVNRNFGSAELLMTQSNRGDRSYLTCVIHLVTLFFLHCYVLVRTNQFAIYNWIRVLLRYSPQMTRTRDDGDDVILVIVSYHAYMHWTSVPEERLLVRKYR